MEQSCVTPASWLRPFFPLKRFQKIERFQWADNCTVHRLGSWVVQNTYQNGTLVGHDFKNITFE